MRDMNVLGQERATFLAGGPISDLNILKDLSKFLSHVVSRRDLASKQSNFTFINQFCNRDWFFPDASDNFAIQDHQIPCHGPHLQSFPQATKFYAAGRI